MERHVYDTLHLFCRHGGGVYPSDPVSPKRQDNPRHADTSAARYEQAEQQAHATRYDQARTKTNKERMNERATVINGASVKKRGPGVEAWRGEALTWPIDRSD